MGKKNTKYFSHILLKSFFFFFLEAEGLETFQGKCNQYILGFVQQPNVTDNSNYIWNWKSHIERVSLFLVPRNSSKIIPGCKHWESKCIHFRPLWVSFNCNVYVSTVRLLATVLLYSFLQLELWSLNCEKLFTALGKLFQDLTDLTIIKLFIALHLNYFFFFHFVPSSWLYFTALIALNPFFSVALILLITLKLLLSLSTIFGLGYF